MKSQLKVKGMKTFAHFVLLICFVSLWLIPDISFAQQDSGAQAGILWGLSVPDAANTNPRSLIGVKGNALLTSKFSIGGYYLVHNSEEGSDGRKFDYSLHGLEGAYRVSKGKGSTFAGIRMGLTKVKAETSTPEPYILSPYHYGFVAGHDFTITSFMSIGFEGSYIALEKSKSTVSGVDYEEKSFNIISFLIAVQFKL